MFRYLLILSILLYSCQIKDKEPDEKWIAIFNGTDLEGWTPKISGYEAGEDFRNTFRVEEGVLKVSYSAYDSFRGEFGHLFYKEELSHYRLRLEYRFTGDQLPGGPSWALMNSGVMVHAQSPESMSRTQDFPVCLEAQFLGGTPGSVRPTGNLCTPGTHVYIADTLTTQHCLNSTSKTYLHNEWVRAEIVVFGDSVLHHIVNGDTVFTYFRPIIGGDHLPDDYPDAPGTPLTKGYIALQSESHPVEFRAIELMKMSSRK